MSENTEYKPFTYIEQYNPTPGKTEFCNTVRELSVKKNDCSPGKVGSTETLTAGANHFVSASNEADANAQADAWLKANAQAYANNLGTCSNTGPTAWRAINPSCVLEPSITLNNFDYVVVRYKWVLGAGQDLDTYTGIINTGISLLDNKWMGWNHGFGSELPNYASAQDSYIMWAGDNTSANGVETCLINYNKIIAKYPELHSFQLRMAANWYSSKDTGNIGIEITTYKGGTMSKSGTDIINTDGTQVQQLTFSKNIPVQGSSLSRNINLVTNIGYITFDKNSSTGQIVITY